MKTLHALTAAVAIAAFVGTTHAAINTYTGANGKFNTDTWSNGANWSTGIMPSFLDTGVAIGAGKHVSANFGTTGPYPGDLTLEANSILELGISATATDQDNVLGTGSIIMEAGSRLLMRTPATTTNSENVVMNGDAEFAIGTSTSSHGRNRTWTGNFSGAASVGIRTTNRQALFLTGDNSGLGGWMYIGDGAPAPFSNNLSENNRAALVADGTEALPDRLQVGGGINLVVKQANTISDFIIFGASNDQQGHIKLLLNADLTVNAATVKGVVLAPGIYNTASGILDDDGVTNFFGGSGNLIVLPEPASLALIGLGGLMLVRRRR